MKNSNLSSPPREHDVKVGISPRRTEREPTSQNVVQARQPLPEPTTKPKTAGVRISAHALRWTWKISGTTSRKPDVINKMKNWTRKIYNWEGTKIILNTRTLEIYMRSRAYKNPQKMIYANWDKADRISRSFSTWARIGLIPIESDHPADCQGAHLVLETKDLNPYLKPQADLPSSSRIGLTYDKSHPGQPELEGPESIEGSFGADYIFLDFPKEFKQLRASQKNTEILMAGFSEYNRNIQLHLAVLREMSETMKAIRENLKV